MVKTYSDALNPAATPQSQPLRGHETEMHRNLAGGYVFTADSWAVLDRFLILGTEGGTYYANERDHTVQATDTVLRCIKEDGPRVVQRVVDISQSGRAPRNTPCVVMLALCAKSPDEATRRAAYQALPQVCRIGTDLFAWAEIINTQGGWGRGARKAVANWYTGLELGRVAYQAVKYRQRNGWTHRDLLRLAHPKPRDAAENALMYWIAQPQRSPEHYQPFEAVVMPRIIQGFEAVQRAASAKEAAGLIRDFRLPREAVKPEHLEAPEVWEALLQDMPLTALVRNLGNLTKVGVVAPMSAGAAKVLADLGDTERLRRARIHPMALLLAQRTYAQGRGFRGKGQWKPVQPVVDALGEAFYAAFANVTPSGKRHLLGVDVSGSMATCAISNYPMMACEAAAAMALITVSTEPNTHIIGFDTGPKELRISPKMRLDDAIRVVRNITHGGTDCAVPIRFAESMTKQGVAPEVICIYTDTESWAGPTHTWVAMEHYRKAVLPSALLVEHAFTGTNSRLSMPQDMQSLLLIGLDATSAALQAQFASGLLGG